MIYLQFTHIKEQNYIVCGQQQYFFTINFLTLCNRIRSSEIYIHAKIMVKKHNIQYFIRKIQIYNILT